MIDIQNTADLNSFLKNLPIGEKWLSFNSEQQNAIIERAYFDVTAYTSMIAAEFDPDNEFCIRALFEQTAHLTAQYGNETDGKTILEETITGFGSRKYKDKSTEWLSPHAKAYLDRIKIKINIIR